MQYSVANLEHLLLSQTSKCQLVAVPLPHLTMDLGGLGVRSGF